jgi:hypothetical protein
LTDVVVPATIRATDARANERTSRASPARLSSKGEDVVATYEDAGLIVQLMRWGSEMGLQDSLNALFSDEFDAEDGAQHNDDVRKVLFFGETVATLVKHNVLDRDLLNDLLWMPGIWGRVKASALHARELSGVAALYENFEALAAS